MWSLREFAAGLKEVALDEVRMWLKIVGYAIIWGISAVLIGSVAEIALGDEFQRATLVVTLVAATAITYIVSKYLKIALNR